MLHTFIDVTEVDQRRCDALPAILSIYRVVKVVKVCCILISLLVMQDVERLTVFYRQLCPTSDTVL